MSGSASGNLWAPDIPRQANVTGYNDFNDEQNPTITYNNPGGFRINARLEFGGTNIRRDNIPNTGSYTFNLTDDERKLLRQKCTGDSMTVRGVIATCIGGTTENYWSYWDRTLYRKRRINVFSQANVRKLGDPYVYTGGSYKRGIPYVYKNGAWKMGTS